MRKLSESSPRRRKDIRLILTLTIKEYSYDESIDTQDTSHDNRNDGLEEEFWLQDDCAADAHSRLGSSVCGSEVSEDQSCCDTHVSEEGALVAIVVCIERKISTNVNANSHI